MNKLLNTIKSTMTGMTYKMFLDMNLISIGITDRILIFLKFMIVIIGLNLFST